MRIGFAVVAVVAGAAAAALAPAATSRDRVLRFSVVDRGAAPEESSVRPGYAFANIADRVNEDPLEQPGRVNPIDYRKFAAVYVLVVRPTSGWTLAVRRLTLQRRGVTEQVCARVQVSPPRPGQVVTQVKTHSWILVKIPRRAFGASVPDSVVARDTNGKLLFHLASTRPAVCR